MASNDKNYIGAALAFGIASAVVFNAASDLGDAHKTVAPIATDQQTASLSLTPKEAVRRFDGLCTQTDPKSGKLKAYARFLPNKYDYNTKLQPSAPITKGEHIRGLLIQPQADVEGFVRRVEKSGIKNDFVELQKTEAIKALDAFEARKSGADKRAVAKLPSCAKPFPAP